MRIFRLLNTRRWPLQRVAAISTVAVVALTAAAIIVPFWLLSARETATLQQRLNAAIVGDVEQEIDALFLRIEALQETARSVLAASAVDIQAKVPREALFLGLLRADPAISWVSFGFPNGDFYGANRRDNNQYRLVESRWDPETGKANRGIDYYADYQGALYQTHSKMIENDYNATDRGWFKAAMTEQGAIWTDVYRFASSGRPGLNTAVRVEEAGAVLGVVSFAVELDRLDAWLRQRMAGKDGMAFVLGPNGLVVAASEAGVAVQAADGALLDDNQLLPTPEQSGAPMLAALAPTLQALPTGVPSHMKLDLPALGGRAFLNLTPLARGGWTMGTVLPENAFAGDVIAERRRMIFAALAVLALTALGAIRVTRTLFVAPLQAAAAELQRFGRFELSGRRPLRSSIEEVAQLGEGLEGARRSLAAMARYAPAELARLVIQDRDAAAVVERRTITVLFLDLEGFTAATERLGHRLAPQLNTFLTAMTGEVRAAGGVVDKFIGDAVMALFGAPDQDEDHALNACRAALGCIAALERLNRGWAEAGMPTFRMRIGVNTGRVLVGSIGAPDRLNYTALGDPVNLAARLESLNREYGTAIMIGAQTYDLVKYDVAARRLDDVRVKGKTERVPVFELLELTVGERPERAPWALRYEAGLDAMQDGDMAEARAHFEAVIELRGADTATTAMLARMPPTRDPAFDKLENAARALAAG